MTDTGHMAGDPPPRDGSARLRFDAASETRIGQVRTHNEDNCLVTTSLLAVADGMGGHAAGEVASGIAVDVLADGEDLNTIESIVRTVGDANTRILESAVIDSGKRGMGTTLCLVAVVVDGQSDMVAVVNVGDSRVYALTDGVMQQLTEDHSLVETLVREGRITPEEAATHPQRNVLTRAMGVDHEVLMDVWLLDPRPGDRFLLCSDGLFNELDHDGIERALADSDTPADAVASLAEAADAAGGRDNITVVVADVRGARGSSEPLGSRLRWIGTSSGGDKGGDHVPDHDTASVPVVTPTPPPPPETSQTDGTTPEADAPTDESGTALDELDDPIDDPSDADPTVPGGVTPTGLDQSDGTGLRWRIIAFIVAIIVIVGVGFAAVLMDQRRVWTVQSVDDQVVMYRGRSDSLPLIGGSDRTVISDIVVDELTEANQRRLEQGEHFDTRSDAMDYIDRLRDSTATTTTTTTTTAPTTTSSDVPATPAPATIAEPDDQAVGSSGEP